MSFSKQICVALAVIGVITVGIGGLFVRSSQTVLNKVSVANSNALPRARSLGELALCVEELQRKMLVALSVGVSPATGESERYIDRLQSEIRSGLSAYSQSRLSDNEKEMFARLQPDFEHLRSSWEHAKAANHAGQTQEASAAYYGQLAPAAERLLKDIREERNYSKTDANRRAAEAFEAGANAEAIAWISFGLLLLVAVGAGFYFFRVISRFDNKLKSAVEQLNNSTLRIASAAGEVAASSQTLAQGASEQAATLEETSASGQEMNAMTQRSAENSQSAAALMREVDIRVARANEALSLLVASMGQISDSSERIAGIIKVIDDIAFQTNILALNAAVEAARAGEAGMGFAVVADEVRNLAQRCAVAARDTTTLIKESAGNAKAGRVRLDEVSSLIHDITQNSSKVKTLVDEVNQAGTEQARGIDQVSRALSQLEKVTQQNAANAEESAAASEELRSQTEVMKAVVNTFEQLLSGGLSSTQAEPKIDVGPGPEPEQPPVYAHTEKAVSARYAAPAPVPASSATIDRSSFPLDDDEFQSF
ncbi:MAG TPA: methyl-accepting chemotaxis protein [Bryobacteraceae bacterium]|nr:methyl-accepting chemotaxis protein [Bryobacteraceae bacterium]